MRIGLLFLDGSILILPEGTDIASAQKEAEDHDEDGASTTQVVRINLAGIEPIS